MLKKQRKTIWLAACALIAAGSAPALADSGTDAGSVTGTDVFTLGQITVTGQREGESPLGYSSLSREELYDFSRDGLPEALNLVPGIAMTSGSGNRNESVLSLRGFNRWQVPLTMDGIRLYLPADNRIDFDRFLTPDLSEIQVSKGYVSVLNGPDGMGGTINLVTRKPVKPFEAELRDTMSLGNDGRYSGNTVYGNVGGRLEKFYYQVSLEERNINHWRMSDDFERTKAEDGGNRDHTDKKDWRTNMKVGFTPNSTDEYSLNFMKQAGEKHGIGSVTGESTISLWDWPKWDVVSIYGLGHTQLGNSSYLKTKIYYNEFKNDLTAYTDLELSKPNWTSHYDDNAYGASVELGTTHFERHTLKGALHYRRDNHTEWQYTHKTRFTEPKQDTEEEIYSVALEDTFHLTPKLDLIAGISQDERRTITAEEYSNKDGFFHQPTSDNSATNYQGGLIYRYREQGKAHLSASHRTRFPTMFERFSSRFGGALSNPGLDPERALNLEFGIADTLFSRLHVEVNLFHNTIDDAIQPVAVWYEGKWYNQNRNVGESTFQGVELAFSALATDTLELGGNYTYLDTEIENPDRPGSRLIGIPRHKIFLYGKWTPLEPLHIIPSIEYASRRSSSPSDNSPGYVETGDHTLINLKVGYQLTPQWDFSVAGRNLLDKNYELSDGYPEEGRNFLLTARYQF
ncbi:MAG: TonB-dependent receptor plug domain-containing protein [Desulfobulbus sp.]|jgi:iron complex outermembrane receptor protein